MVGDTGTLDSATTARPSVAARSTQPNGLLVVNKPWGWSSHDVVGAVRRLAGTRAVGHAGTLDPLATGVLVLALGPATRVLHAVMELPKTYIAEVRLGATSATDDAEGPLTSTHVVPALSVGAVETALASFVGPQQQRPPAFAAIKVDGQAAYQAARRGEEVDLATRSVTIYALALVRLRLPTATLVVWCSRGTYIRALARDLGERLGTGGYLAGLVRSAVGPFQLRAALSLEQVGASAAAGILSERLYAPETPLAGWPVLVACAQTATDVVHGRSVAVSPPWSTGVSTSWALGPDGRLLALGEVLPASEVVSAGGAWRPRRVFRAPA